MRNTAINRWAVALVAAALAACSSSDENEITPPPALPSAARKVSAIFVDAASSRPISAPLDVTVRSPSGALSTLTRDADGQAQNHFTVTNGIVLFKVVESAALPVTLQVVATGEGFDPAAATVTVTGDGEFAAVARMVNRAAPPAGTTSVARPVGTASATGVTTATMVASTAPTQGATPAVQLTVPAATTLLDSAGQPLTGALTARLSYFDVQEPSSLAMLPGGGDAVVGAQAGRFVSAGFASIEIADASGRRASIASQPMPIAINLAPISNPVTGALVTSGSTIPFWSFSSGAGVWASEPDASVTRDASDRLQALGQPAHLTHFNVGWLDTRACTAPATVLVSGNAANARLTAVLTLTGGGFARTYSPGTDPNAFVLTDAIPGRPAKVSVRLDGSEVGQATILDPCLGGQVPVLVNVPAIQPGGMVVTVDRCCIEDASRCTPVGNNGTVVVIPPGTAVTPWVKSTDANGRAQFDGLRGNVTYRVEASALGEERGAIVNRTIVPGQSVTVGVVLPFSCTATGATGATR